MVLWFLTREYLHDPTLFLHFCDYPLFEEDLDLHLNKLEFPSCKNGLLIEISKMFHFKRFFPIHTCKYSFSSCAPPPDPQGPEFVQA
jgi:hypothetical protein